jgi:hypothetical protein
MTVTDLTAGRTASTGIIGSIKGVPMDYFYDGRSAESIDERTAGASGSYAVDGKYYYYRRTLNSVPTQWEGVWVNGSTRIGSLNRVNVEMRRPNAHLLADPGGGVSNGGLNYYDFWDACA